MSKVCLIYVHWLFSTSKHIWFLFVVHSVRTARTDANKTCSSCYRECPNPGFKVMVLF